MPGGVQLKAVGRSSKISQATVQRARNRMLGGGCSAAPFYARAGATCTIHTPARLHFLMHRFASTLKRNCRPGRPALDPLGRPGRDRPGIRTEETLREKPRRSGVRTDAPLGHVLFGYEPLSHVPLDHAPLGHAPLGHVPRICAPSESVARPQRHATLPAQLECPGPAAVGGWESAPAAARCGRRRLR